MSTQFNTNALKGCQDYLSESYTNFLLSEFASNEIITLSNYDYNHLIVILEGRLLIEYDEFVNTEFSAGEIVFLPAYVKAHIKATQKSRVLIGTFELPSDVYTSKMMESLWELRANTEYTFASLTVNYQMRKYLDLLVMYLEDGMQCARLHEAKEKEMFLVLRWYYSDEDFVKLFHTIIGKSLDFRALVVKNYDKVKNVAELARKIGMSRSNFDIKFKEVFEMPPKQWMLKRKARSIRYYMSKPEITISDIMIKYDFDSFTQFNRFCKQQFGATPSELMKEKKQHK